MAKNDLVTYVGEIGPYQWRIFAIAFIITTFGVDSIHIVFIGADMSHWCLVPELADLPYDVQKNVAIPTESDELGDGSVEYSSCEMYSLNYSVYNRSEFYRWNRSLMVSNETSVIQCTRWTYDQSQFTSTIVKKVRNTI